VSHDELVSLVPFLFVVLTVAVIFVPTLIIATRARRRRTRDLAALADRLGFRLRRGPDPRGAIELPGFQDDPIRPGFDALNTIEGRARVLDRQYEARMGDCLSRLQRTLNHDDPLVDAMAKPKEMLTYVALRLPTTVIPDVVVMPRMGAPRVLAAPGLEAVHFELDAFNAAFLVASSKPRFAYDILTPENIELIMAWRPPRLHVGCGWCVVRSTDRPWTPDEMEGALKFLGNFVGRWPNFVLADLDAMAPRRPHRQPF
jgi:hypothetical protein